MEKKNNLINIVFLLAGLGVLILGIFLQLSNNKFIKESVKTKATITKIEKEYDGEDTRYYVEVSFDVDGRTHTGVLSEWNATMEEGGTTTVYYKKSNPDTFRGPTSNYIGYIVCGFGVIMVAVFAVSLIKKVKFKQLKNNLKTCGKRVDAKINSVNLDSSLTVNGVSPYIVSASYVDPTDKKLYTFNSEQIWFDPTPIIDNNMMETIPVYMDINDPTKYIVDIDEFKKYLGN